MKTEQITVNVKGRSVSATKLVAEPSDLLELSRLESKLKATYPGSRAENLTLAALNYGLMLWARRDARGDIELTDKKKIAAAEAAVMESCANDPVIRDAYFEAFKGGLASKEAWLLTYYNDNLAE